MKFSALIYELRRNILRDVSDAISADEADLLWSDPSLAVYVNEGYFRFCHLTEYLHDVTTPAVCQITLQEGVRDYQLHKSVIRVQSVETENLVLPVQAVDNYLGDRPDIVTYQPQRKYDVPGLFAVIPDYDVGALKTIGTPTAEYDGKILTLRVTRYPLEKLTLDNPSAEPELPEQFQLDMLEWAAFRALRNHDTDAENMNKASAHKTRFEQAVQEIKDELRARKFARIDFSPSWRWT